MPRRLPLPPDLRAVLEDGPSRRRPAPAVTAATVMLVREPALRGTGVEVWLLRRSDAMAAAPGATAFPGGGLDERDADPDVPWRGAPVDGWGRRLGLPDADAAALLCAAVRETYEECGVLLAEVDRHRPDAEEPGGVGLPPAEEDAERAALARREVSLSELLVRRGLALRSDLLRPWARWVTPEVAPRRHDTWFFLAVAPQGARARHDGAPGHAGEADEGAWWRPADALDAEAEGLLRLLAPTRVALEELAAAEGLEDLLAARRSLEAVTPRVAGGPDDLHLLVDLPEQPGPP